MQFKLVNKRIHILACRGTDPIKKRSIVKMVGSLDEDLNPSHNLIENITEKEEIELMNFIAEESNRREILSSIHAAKHLPDAIDRAIVGVDQGFAPTPHWRKHLDTAIHALAEKLGH
jgi:hypothetical protein